MQITSGDDFNQDNVAAPVIPWETLKTGRDPVTLMNGTSKNKMIGQSSAVYGMGFVGALIYFLQQATSFWMGCLGFAKALVWPGFLVYEILAYLKM